MLVTFGVSLLVVWAISVVSPYDAGQLVHLLLLVGLLLLLIAWRRRGMSLWPGHARQSRRRQTNGAVFRGDARSANSCAVTAMARLICSSAKRPRLRSSSRSTQRLEQGVISPIGTMLGGFALVSA